MRDTIRLFDLRLEDSPKKRPDPFDFSEIGFYFFNKNGSSFLVARQPAAPVNFSVGYASPTSASNCSTTRRCILFSSGIQKPAIR